VLSGLPHYPGTTVFPAYKDGQLQHETMGNVVVERVRSGPPVRSSTLARILNEAGFLMRGLGTLASGRIKRHPVVLALCPSILCVALALAARQRGGSAIAIVHDIQSGLAQQLGMNGGALGRLMRWVERATLDRVDLVVVLSQEMKDQLRRIGVTAPIDVVPLWVDTDEIQAVDNIMAVGRPFVATALPDSTLWRLQKQSGAFLCVPPDEPLRFAEAVLQLADDPQLRHELGRRGRKFVEQHYAKPLILSQFASRLDALVAGR
jgi:glycosyltransferase involved in cell wall biosynthesis